jgi:hypothetical protein
VGKVRGKIYGNPLSENSVWKMIHPNVLRYPCVRVAQKMFFVFRKLCCVHRAKERGEEGEKKSETKGEEKNRSEISFFCALINQPSLENEMLEWISIVDCRINK